MERRDFFKGLIASALAVTIAPFVISNPIPKYPKGGNLAIYGISYEIAKDGRVLVMHDLRRI